MTQMIALINDIKTENHILYVKGRITGTMKKRVVEVVIVVSMVVIARVRVK